MKPGKIFPFAVLASAAAMLLQSPMALAQQHGDAPRVVTWNCSGCHGVDGNSQPPYFPRLAGLSAAYSQQRIAEFRENAAPQSEELFYRVIGRYRRKSDSSSPEARINMIGMAHAMTVKEVKTSAAWYAMQKPAGGRPGNPALIQEGKELFLKGVAAQGMLPCQTCHGAEAEGKAKAPRLAGQNSSYLLSQMTKFTVGDRKHAPEMTMVAQHVDSQQFEALAAYLQSR